MIIARDPGKFFSNKNARVVLLNKKTDRENQKYIIDWMKENQIPFRVIDDQYREANTKIYCTITEEQKFELLMAFK